MGFGMVRCAVCAGLIVCLLRREDALPRIGREFHVLGNTLVPVSASPAKGPQGKAVPRPENASSLSFLPAEGSQCRRPEVPSGAKENAS